MGRQCIRGRADRQGHAKRVGRRAHTEFASDADTPKYPQRGRDHADDRYPGPPPDQGEAAVSRLDENSALRTIGAHGLPRTNADKRRAVTMLLEDPEWTQWSDREIAKACSVSNHLVGDVRAALTGNSPSETPAARTYTNKHGTQATMKTAKVRKTKPAAKPSTPPASDDTGSENQDSPANLISAPLTGDRYARDRHPGPTRSTARSP